MFEPKILNTIVETHQRRLIERLSGTRLNFFIVFALLNAAALVVLNFAPLLLNYVKIQMAYGLISSINCLLVLVVTGLHFSIITKMAFTAVSVVFSLAALSSVMELNSIHQSTAVLAIPIEAFVILLIGLANDARMGIHNLNWSVTDVLLLVIVAGIVTPIFLVHNSILAIQHYPFSEYLPSALKAIAHVAIVWTLVIGYLRLIKTGVEDFVALVVVITIGVLASLIPNWTPLEGPIYEQFFFVFWSMLCMTPIHKFNWQQKPAANGT